MTRSAPATNEDSPVFIRIGEDAIAGDLVMPQGALGIVVFAHGSGSSRHSPRNRFVAHELQQAGMATLLMDLLTADEERFDEICGSLRFDIGLLAGRLERSSDWVKHNPSTHGLPMAYFGASTGAAAALVAAADRRKDVRAVVSRGGRPDLATGSLRVVAAPTLLIVGGDDHVVIELNRRALDQLACEKRLEIVRGASHLFEEPGTLEQVAGLAVDWFGRHLLKS